MTALQERDLDILQITINNACNLACPHCYLNMAGSGYMTAETIEAIFDDRNCPEKIAIVGMEPLYDPQSVALVRTIARRGHESDTFVSMITNGLGLKHLRKVPRAEIPDLIDISLDGGPKHYSRFRGNGKDHFPKIRAGAQAFLEAHTDIPVNILHTLFAENSTSEIITDMMEGGRLVSPAGSIFFSPFIAPAIQSGERVPTAMTQGLERMLQALSDNSAFMDDASSFLFMGTYNAEALGVTVQELLVLIEKYGLAAKSRIDQGVPHLNGQLRVMFDGCAIRPDYSIHTRLTHEHKIPIAGRSLTEIYEGFKSLPSVSEALAN